MDILKHLRFYKEHPEKIAYNHLSGGEYHFVISVLLDEQRNNDFVLSSQQQKWAIHLIDKIESKLGKRPFSPLARVYFLKPYNLDVVKIGVSGNPIQRTWGLHREGWHAFHLSKSYGSRLMNYVRAKDIEGFFETGIRL